jgi:hypothetical protein
LDADKLRNVHRLPASRVGFQHERKDFLEIVSQLVERGSLGVGAWQSRNDSDVETGLWIPLHVDRKCLALHATRFSRVVPGRLPYVHYITGPAGYPRNAVDTLDRAIFIGRNVREICGRNRHTVPPDHRDEVTDREVPEFQFVQNVFVFGEDVLGIDPVERRSTSSLPGPEECVGGPAFVDRLLLLP